MAKNFARNDLVLVVIEGAVYIGRVRRVDGDMVTVGPPGLIHETTVIQDMPVTEVCVARRRHVKLVPTSRS